MAVLNAGIAAGLDLSGPIVAASLGGWVGAAFLLFMLSVWIAAKFDPIEKIRESVGFLFTEHYEKSIRKAYEAFKPLTRTKDGLAAYCDVIAYAHKNEPQVLSECLDTLALLKHLIQTVPDLRIYGRVLVDGGRWETYSHDDAGRYRPDLDGHCSPNELRVLPFLVYQHLRYVIDQIHSPDDLRRNLYFLYVIAIWQRTTEGDSYLFDLDHIKLLIRRFGLRPLALLVRNMPKHANAILRYAVPQIVPKVSSGSDLLDKSLILEGLELARSKNWGEPYVTDYRDPMGQPFSEETDPNDIAKMYIDRAKPAIKKANFSQFILSKETVPPHG